MDGSVQPVGCVRRPARRRAENIWALGPELDAANRGWQLGGRWRHGGRGRVLRSMQQGRPTQSPASGLACDRVCGARLPAAPSPPSLWPAPPSPAPAPSPCSSSSRRQALAHSFQQLPSAVELSNHRMRMCAPPSALPDRVFCVGSMVAHGRNHKRAQPQAGATTSGRNHKRSTKNTTGELTSPASSQLPPPRAPLTLWPAAPAPAHVRPSGSRPPPPEGMANGKS